MYSNMPRVKINYQNTIIYKIQHMDKPDILIYGHTSEFNKRKNLHKTSSQTEPLKTESLKLPSKAMLLNEPKGLYKQLHQLIKDNGGFDEFKMIEVSKFPCKDGNEADAEVWRYQLEHKMIQLNKQFEVDQMKIINGDEVIIKHRVKPLKFVKN